MGLKYLNYFVKLLISDVPFGTYEDFIFSLEFQSYKIDYRKETIFNMYQASLHNKYQKPVITVVFSMIHDEHKIITHKINPYDEFTMLIISLKSLNQKQSINNSLYKISNKINLLNKEKALFLLSPMMDLDYNIEALDVLINTFYQINNLSLQELEDMKTIIWLYVEKWCNKEFITNEGGSDMAVLTPGAKKIKEEIFNQAKEEVIKKIISNGLSNGFSFEETAKLTGLSVEEISAIAKNK